MVSHGSLADWKATQHLVNCPCIEPDRGFPERYACVPPRVHHTLLFHGVPGQLQWPRSLLRHWEWGMGSFFGPILASMGSVRIILLHMPAYLPECSPLTQSPSCACAEGYTGMDCSADLCPGDCSGHGQCVSAGCQCAPGYACVFPCQQCPLFSLSLTFITCKFVKCCRVMPAQGWIAPLASAILIGSALVHPAAYWTP